MLCTLNSDASLGVHHTHQFHRCIVRSHGLLSPSVLYSYGILAGLGVPHSTDCKAHRDIIVLEYVKATDLI